MPNLILTGVGPCENGDGITGTVYENTYFEEIPWSNGKFYKGNDSSNTIEFDTHIGPNYKISVSMDKNKKVSINISMIDSDGFLNNGIVGIELWDDSHKNNVGRIMDIWFSSQGSLSITDINCSALNLPIYVRPICSYCHTPLTNTAVYGYNSKCKDKSSGKLQGYKIVNAHTHVNRPDPPMLMSTSGTTAILYHHVDGHTTRIGRFKGPGDGYELKNTASDTSKAIFTDLEMGLGTHFISQTYCGTDCTNSESNRWFESVHSTLVNTWDITADCTEITSNKLSYKVTQIPGSMPSTFNYNIKCALYASESDRNSFANPVTSIQTISNNSGTVSFTGLQGNKKYYFRAWTDETKVHDQNNKADNYIDLENTTNQSFSIRNISIYRSATTLSITAVLNTSGDSSNIKCNMTCNGVTKTISASSNSTATYITGFTGLTSGKRYTINFLFYNTSGTSLAAVRYVTTYELTFSRPQTSTSAISLRTDTNSTDAVVQTQVERVSPNFTQYAWSDVENGIKKIYSDLQHNTEYICKARIKNCLACDDNGIRTTTNDSMITRTVKTNKLVVELILDKVFRTQIIWKIGIYLDTPIPSQLYGKDPITHVKFTASSLKTYVVPTEGYMCESVKRNNSSDKYVVGNTQMAYNETTRKVYSNSLPYPYCMYEVEVEITDGYNKVKKSLLAATSFPYMKIFINNDWHNAMPYIYKDGEWKAAIPMVYNGSEFKICNTSE